MLPHLIWIIKFLAPAAGVYWRFYWVMDVGLSDDNKHISVDDPKY